MNTHRNQTNVVQRYYTAFGNREWHRLDASAEGAIEFELNCRALLQHLPAGGRILDIGGGPGRYSIWLAEHGYQVVLADLTPALLDVARQKIAQITNNRVRQNIEQIETADVRDLSAFEDDAFDAALCLGPFYHLQHSDDRTRAIKELTRVLKPGAMAAIALMTKNALLRRTFAIPEEWPHLKNRQWMTGLLKEGVFNNDQPGRFDGGFCIDPANVPELFATHGLKTISLWGSESLSIGLSAELASMASSDPEAYAVALTLLAQRATDPSILGLCSHLLLIARSHRRIESRNPRMETR